ncbi:L-rhamnose-binding lectin SML-like [Antennarius striatus]|uniref:L-rhamnose-binding lectin SML-like n=1 Tax=Antennarius striatus TaxID=241820 RepID=UPI0035B36535
MIRLITILCLVCVLLPKGSLVESVYTLTCGEPENVHRMTCETGVIVIFEAKYGRSNKDTCSEGKENTDDWKNWCLQQDTYFTLSDRCNGRQVCEIPIKSIDDPNSCKFTSKYLETRHFCLPYLHTVGCENSTATVNCGEGNAIQIYRAYYGRADIQTCSNGEKLPHLYCGEDVKKKLSASCEGKDSCAVAARDSVFGDPCATFPNYLEVAYRCQKYAVAHEGSTIHLTCDKRESIWIYKATYGRKDTKDSGTNCKKKVSLHSICRYGSTCEFVVSNKLLGDPCVGYLKWLTVIYECFED